MAEAPRSSAAALEIRNLNVYYGASHALQGVNLTLASGALSVVGRNGMGKTTLCQAIMGLVPRSPAARSPFPASRWWAPARRHRAARRRIRSPGPPPVAVADGG
jgi:ABC-type glutathione transport system ATPase component